MAPRRILAAIAIAGALLAPGLVWTTAASTASLADRVTLPEAGQGSATSVATGFEFSCARFANGTVKCWGYNSSGQLGQGGTATLGDIPGETRMLAPIDLGAGRTATDITAGDYHACALLDDHTIKCWGANGNGQLGQGDTNRRGDNPGELGDTLPPVDLGPGRTAIAVTAGVAHTCALLDDHTVKCWGYNVRGELGRGSTADIGDSPGEMGDNLTPVDLGTGRTASAISAGDHHTCALLDDHTVKCWGYNNRGQLGQGDAAARGNELNELGDHLPPIDVGTGRTVAGVAAGGSHTCVVLDDHTVRCWGDNGDGQLGQGDERIRGDDPGELGNNLPPVDLGGGRTATAVTAGGYHACALLDDHTLKCWGSGHYGQLGQGNSFTRGDNPGAMGDNLAPIDLGTGTHVVAVSSATWHNCAALDNGLVKCWGHNTRGQLGQGSGRGQNDYGDYPADRGDDSGEMGDNLRWVNFGAASTDAEIKLPADRSYVGDGVYNATGAGQGRTKETRTSRSSIRTVTFVIRVRNESPTVDTLTIDPSYNYIYGIGRQYEVDGTDVTSAMNNYPGYAFVNVPPGATRKMTMRVSFLDVDPGTIALTRLTIISRIDSSILDTVKAKVRVIA